MSNKNKIAFLLAMEMFLSGCSNNIKANDTIMNPDESEKINILTYDDVFVDKENFIDHSIEQIPVEVEYVDNYVYVTENTTITLNDTGEIRNINKYQKLYAIDIIGNIARVYTDLDEFAIIDSSKIKTLPKKFVEVDLSSQTLRLYDNFNTIVYTNTVTGKHTTPTKEGYFEIKDKSRNIYLTGPTWRSFVKYWMPYDNEGRGLHDAPWRDESEFNKDTYYYSGSHGCVNLPVDVAPIVYENVEKHTKVLIHE